MATLTLTTAAGTATQTLSTGARGPAGSGGGGGGSYTAGDGIDITGSVISATGASAAVNYDGYYGKLVQYDPESATVWTPNSVSFGFGPNSTGDYSVLQTPAPYTTSQSWHLPDATGTLALTTDIPAAPTAASIAALLGVPTHANLTAANDALAIGSVYYDTALGKLHVTTA